MGARRACRERLHGLFLGTHEDNMRDMMEKGRHAWAKTCAKGHPWTSENTMVAAVKGRPTKRCVTCHKATTGRGDRYRLWPPRGHGKVRIERTEWRCQCGLYLGRSKREATVAMAPHREALAAERLAKLLRDDAA